MTELRHLLDAGDPLRHESLPGPAEVARRRAAVLSAASSRDVRRLPAIGGRRVAWRAALAAVAVVIGLLLLPLWPSIAPTAMAAVRFEVRLAEAAPAPGLREAPVGAQPVVVYVHDELVVTNEHLVRVEVVPVGDRFGVAVRLSPEGARRLREATRTHIGRPLALLVDGLVVMAPTVRSEIADVGLVSGGLSRDEAARLAQGMTPR